MAESCRDPAGSGLAWAGSAGAGRAWSGKWGGGCRARLGWADVSDATSLVGGPSGQSFLDAVLPPDACTQTCAPPTSRGFGQRRVCVRGGRLVGMGGGGGRWKVEMGGSKSKSGSTAPGQRPGARGGGIRAPRAYGHRALRRHTASRGGHGRLGVGMGEGGGGREVEGGEVGGGGEMGVGQNSTARARGLRGYGPILRCAGPLAACTLGRLPPRESERE